MAYARGKYFAIGRVGNGCYGKYVEYLLMVMQETVLKNLEFLQGVGRGTTLRTIDTRQTIANRRLC